MTNSFDLRQLQYFLAAVENGSLGSAARDLRISEPALSKSIRRLEALLDVKLFERGSRGVKPTAFGLSLAEHARLVRMELRRAIDDLDEIRHGGAGHVFVGTGPSAAGTAMPAAVAKLVQKKKDVRVTVVEGMLDTLVPALLGGDLDFVIAALGELPPDPELDQQVLARDVACPALRAGHPLLRSKREPTLADIREQKWALPRRPDIMRQAVDALYRRQGLAPPRPTVEYSGLNFVLALLQEGDFVTFLPKKVAAISGIGERLRFLELAEGTWHRRYGILRRRKSPLSPSARAVVQELRALLA
ncbi:MAG: LysR family transcriptional regulator [Rhodospirillaceae bacterium]|nr:LysR family transcriptional regulator [Rhodospirillaceae bacterium]